MTLSDLATLLTAAAGAIATLVGVYSSYRKSKLAHDAHEEQTRQQLEALQTSTTENHRAILRVAIFSENHPLDARIRAGEEYLKTDGNGMAQLQHEANLKAWREREGL